jgi:hypothetical protein
MMLLVAEICFIDQIEGTVTVRVRTMSCTLAS